MESIIQPTKNLIGLLARSSDSINLEQASFLYPVEILPLAALAQEKKLPVIPPVTERCRDYLSYFCFPDGLGTLSHQASRYIPIYHFPTANASDTNRINKSRILEFLLETCDTKLGSPQGVKDGLAIAVEEIVDNVEQHSGASIGWVNAQYYPRKNFLDFCIVDRGISFKGRYQQSGLREVTNDFQALLLALGGRSTKPERTRGSGLRTFVNIVQDGFEGEVIIISGNAIAFTSNKKLKTGVLTTSWEGTLVAFRLPKTNKPLDYAMYID